MLDPFVYKSDQLRVAVRPRHGRADRRGGGAAQDDSRAMMLCSQNRGDLAQAVAARLGARVVGVCKAARPGMPSAAFDEIVADLGRLRADGFVCVGGGSPTGLAKAVAAATKLPFIAVVTTYSGSEMSRALVHRHGRGRALGRIAGRAAGERDLRSRAHRRPAVRDLGGELHERDGACGRVALRAGRQSDRADAGRGGGRAASRVGAAAPQGAIRRISMRAAMRSTAPGSRRRSAPASACRKRWRSACGRISAPSMRARTRPCCPMRRRSIARPRPTPWSASRARSARPIRRRRSTTSTWPAGSRPDSKDLGMREQDIPRAVDIVAKRKFPNPRPCVGVGHRGRDPAGFRGTAAAVLISRARSPSLHAQALRSLATCSSRSAKHAVSGCTG